MSTLKDLLSSVGGLVKGAATNLTGPADLFVKGTSYIPGMDISGDYAAGKQQIGDWYARNVNPDKTMEYVGEYGPMAVSLGGAIGRGILGLASRGGKRMANKALDGAIASQVTPNVPAPRSLSELLSGTTKSASDKEMYDLIAGELSSGKISDAGLMAIAQKIHRAHPDMALDEARAQALHIIKKNQPILKQHGVPTPELDRFLAKHDSDYLPNLVEKAQEKVQNRSLSDLFGEKVIPGSEAEYALRDAKFNQAGRLASKTEAQLRDLKDYITLQQEHIGQANNLLNPMKPLAERFKTLSEDVKSVDRILANPERYPERVVEQARAYGETWKHELERLKQGMSSGSISQQDAAALGLAREAESKLPGLLERYNTLAGRQRKLTDMETLLQNPATKRQYISASELESLSMGRSTGRGQGFLPDSKLRYTDIDPSTMPSISDTPLKNQRFYDELITRGEGKPMTFKDLIDRVKRKKDVRATATGGLDNTTKTGGF